MYKPDIQHWAVIEFEGRAAIVTIDKKNPCLWYWYGGATHLSSKKPPKILHDFGNIDDLDEESIDECYIYFYSHFNVPKESPPIKSGGWVSPEGKFYPCNYALHDEYANHLAALYYSSLEGTRELEKRKWLRIYDTGAIAIDWDDVDSISQKQLDFIFDLSKKTPLPFREEVEEVLELIIWKKSAK